MVRPVAEKSGVKIVAKNPKAFHEYYIVERYEAGIELFGTEVKSIRAGNLSLKEAWCSIQNGELYLKQMHISPYERGSFSNQDPLRPKRLLMHKKEIMQLLGKTQQQGYALVPLSVYFKNSRVKVEIALAKGKKLHDKRAVAAEKDAKRQIDRAMKERNQY
jgi:SsrA-binding protein